MIGPNNNSNSTENTSDAHALCDWHTTQLAGPRQLGNLIFLSDEWPVVEMRLCRLFDFYYIMLKLERAKVIYG